MFRIDFYAAAFLIIFIPIILLTIIGKSFIKGLRRKEKIKDLIKKNRIYIWILVIEIIGLILARIKFYMDFNI